MTARQNLWWLALRVASGERLDDLYWHYATILLWQESRQGWVWS